MPRVKGGAVARHRHKKVLKLTEGHQSSRRKLFRRAHESMIHALSYSYRHRRERKGDMRRLWITRINAAARSQGISYSQLIMGLRKADIDLNRKMLAEMAVNDPTGFSAIAVMAGAKAQA